MKAHTWPIAVKMNPEQRRRYRRKLAKSNAATLLAYNSREEQELRHHPKCSNPHCESHGHRKWYGGCCSKQCQRILRGLRSAEQQLGAMKRLARTIGAKIATGRTLATAMLVIAAFLTSGCAASLELCPNALRTARQMRHDAGIPKAIPSRELPAVPELGPAVPIVPREKLEPIPDPTFSAPVKTEDLFKDPPAENVPTLPRAELPEPQATETPAAATSNEQATAPNTDQTAAGPAPQASTPAAEDSTPPLKAAPGTGRAVIYGIAIVAMLASAILKRAQEPTANGEETSGARAGAGEAGGPAGDHDAGSG